MQKCTLALGCFWKPEENFKSKPGVVETEVGYAGGSDSKVTYEEVCTGNSGCLLYTSPSPRDLSTSRMPSSA